MTRNLYSTPDEARVNVLPVFAGMDCIGHLFHRRGAWAAFRLNGERVGSFETVREASASLGGRA